MSEVLVSDEYKAEQQRMHATHNDYGVACLSYVKEIAHVIQSGKYTTMLDYGAGKGRLVPALAKLLDADQDLVVELYDPGIPGIDAPPDPAELVTCIDVLEHVEPQYTLGVLHDLKRVAQKMVFITIGMRPAAKVLSDGRNAHINLRTTNAWLYLLLDKFDLVYALDRGHTLVFVGKAKS